MRRTRIRKNNERVLLFPTRTSCIVSCMFYNNWLVRPLLLLLLILQLQLRSPIIITTTINTTAVAAAAAASSSSSPSPKTTTSRATTTASSRTNNKNKPSSALTPSSTSSSSSTASTSTNHRTRVTGYGSSSHSHSHSHRSRSRSSSKRSSATSTIRRQVHDYRSSKTKKKQAEDEKKKAKKKDAVVKDPLHRLIVIENDNDRHHHHDRDNNIQVLCLAKNKTINLPEVLLLSAAPNGVTTPITTDDSLTTTTTTSPEATEGTPVEGLYGIYSIPSGTLWVWIAESQLVYEAPKICGNEGGGERASSSSWWQIRKVTRLHITKQPLPSTTTSRRPISLSRSVRQEESRQLKLLRTSLKQHEWYYCPPTVAAAESIGTAEEGGEAGVEDSYCPDNHLIVRDMTQNLQRSVELYNNNAAEDRSGDDQQQEKPDSRFFWNEDLLYPLHYNGDVTSNHGANNDSARQLLLDHVIPTTSAFVGIQANMSVPATSGSASSYSNSSCYYDQLLITRRSRYRAGTRFTKRGSDHLGHVANYAETEQVLVLHNRTGDDENSSSNSASGSGTGLVSVCSHVQTRGSIPLRWSSPSDIKTYRPRVLIGTNPLLQARALQLHLLDQISRYAIDSPQVTKQYPSLVFVNLVDKHSDQGRLGRAFDAVLVAVLDVNRGKNNTSDQPIASQIISMDNTTVQHIWYDFHAEVKNGRWDKLTHLLDSVKGSLLEQSYFRAEVVPVVVPEEMMEDDDDDGQHQQSPLPPLLLNQTHLQTGTIRTNCMDCLDRTNVVQSMFGRYMLFQQLADTKRMRIPLPFKTTFRKNPVNLPWPNGEAAHRLLWADNADAVSRLYAGTSALKGDFTRTGKRTRKGALDDGMNSLQRYYLNNFIDADRQEGMDLLVGAQPFTAEDELNYSNSGRSSSLSTRGARMRDAARRSLLGPAGSFFGDNDDDDDSGGGPEDSDHVRIKTVERAIGRFGSLPVGGAIDQQRPRPQRKPSLGLRWLPGDLQTQVRSLVSSSSSSSLADEIPETSSYWSAFQALEDRSLSGTPWWATTGDLSSSSDTEREDSISSSSPVVNPDVANAEAAAANNAGYLLGAMVVGTQSPLGMAALVVALIGTSS